MRTNSRLCYKFCYSKKRRLINKTKAHEQQLELQRTGLLFFTRLMRPVSGFCRVGMLFPRVTNRCKPKLQQYVIYDKLELQALASCTIFPWKFTTYLHKRGKTYLTKGQRGEKLPTKGGKNVPGFDRMPCHGRYTLIRYYLVRNFNGSVLDFIFLEIHNDSQFHKSETS